MALAYVDQSCRYLDGVVKDDNLSWVADAVVDEEGTPLDRKSVV